MNWLKDRHTRALLLLLAGIIIMGYSARQEDLKHTKIGILGFLLTISGSIHLFANLFVKKISAGRLHSKKGKKVIIKKEEGSGFEEYEGDFPVAVDGIFLNGKRFKILNGTDYYLTKNNKLRRMGPGTYVMEKLGGGGWEPDSIQNDKNWIVPDKFLK